MKVTISVTVEPDCVDNLAPEDVRKWVEDTLEETNVMGIISNVWVIKAEGLEEEDDNS